MTFIKELKFGQLDADEIKELFEKTQKKYKQEIKNNIEWVSAFQNKDAVLAYNKSLELFEKIFGE